MVTESGGEFSKAVRIAFVSSSFLPAKQSCIAAMMCGTAGLPHVIVRFYTVKTVQAARWSAMWALFFIAILYVTAPATAAFARFFMIESLNGATEQTLPGWYESWEQTGLILWLDNGDGVVEIVGNRCGDGSEESQFLFPVEPFGMFLRHGIYFFPVTSLILSMRTASPTGFSRMS